MRWMTREEMDTERVAEPLRWQVIRWREKRRKTHALLKAARREIQRLRKQASQ
jgi:hypothetical protein